MTHTPTPTRTGPRRCWCCHAPYGQGCIRDRPCQCTRESCARCSRCLAHCTCGREAAGAQHTKNIADVNGLTDMTDYGIITEVGCLPTKGGCCDNDGRIFNSQGGVHRTESLYRNGQAYVSPPGTTCNQGQWTVAYLQRPVRGAKTTRTVYTVPGKLNSSSVARCDSLTIATRQQTAVRPRYLTAYCNPLHSVVQGCSRLWVAVRRDLPL